MLYCVRTQPNPGTMADGLWTTQRDKRESRQLAADARELLREQIRLEKRQLRDLRYCVERSTLTEAEWKDFLALHEQHGKEGIRQLWEDLVPYWNQCQVLNGGAQCPSNLKPSGLEIKCIKSAQESEVSKAPARDGRTKPTTRKLPGSPRKPRIDAGKKRSSYKTRKPKP